MPLCPDHEVRQREKEHLTTDSVFPPSRLGRPSLRRCVDVMGADYDDEIRVFYRRFFWGGLVTLEKLFCGVYHQVHIIISIRLNVFSIDSFFLVRGGGYPDRANVSGPDLAGERHRPELARDG